MKTKNIFYGYWVLFSCFLFCLVSIGSGANTFGLFITHLQNALGSNRTEIMGAFTVYTVIAGLSAPFAGRLLDKHGAKIVAIAGCIITTAGLVLLSRTRTIAHLYIGYFLVGVGTTATGPVASSYVVSQWFKARRGMAIGLMSMGMSASGFLFAPFVAVVLIPNIGWSNSYITIALINLGVIIPLSLFVIKTKPEEMGLFPDGIKSTVYKDKTIECADIASGSISLKEAVATSAFWLIAVSLLFNHTHLGIYVSIFPHLRDLNFPVGISASALSVTSIMSFTGMFVFGSLCDRIKAKYASVIGLGFILIGTLIFSILNAGSPVVLIWLFAAILGFGIGSWMPTMSMLTSSTFGLTSYGTIFGVMSIFQNGGGGIGPLAAGIIYDVTGTYRTAAFVIGGFLVIAIPLVLLVRKPVGTQ